MKAMQEGSNFFDWTHKRLNGKEFPATILLTRVNIDDDNPFLQATVRDITNRKKAEKEKEKFIKFAVGRELKMVELKNEINSLYKKLGQNQKYMTK